MSPDRLWVYWTPPRLEIDRPSMSRSVARPRTKIMRPDPTAFTVNTPRSAPPRFLFRSSGPPRFLFLSSGPPRGAPRPVHYRHHYLWDITYTYLYSIYRYSIYRTLILYTSIERSNHMRRSPGPRQRDSRPAPSRRVAFSGGYRALIYFLEGKPRLRHMYPLRKFIRWRHMCWDNWQQAAEAMELWAGW